MGRRIGSASPKARMSLHSFLTRLIWLCVLPLVALAVYLSVSQRADHPVGSRHPGRQPRQEFRDGDRPEPDGAHRRAADLALSSHADDPSTWEELYQEAQGFRQSFGSHVILRRPGQRECCSTRACPSVPRCPCCRGPAATTRSRSRRGPAWPAVSNIVFGPVANKRLVAITVPGLRDGQTGLLHGRHVRARPIPGPARADGAALRLVPRAARRRWPGDRPPCAAGLRFRRRRRCRRAASLPSRRCRRGRWCSRFHAKSIARR